MTCTYLTSCELGNRNSDTCIEQFKHCDRFIRIKKAELTERIESYLEIARGASPVSQRRIEQKLRHLAGEYHELTGEFYRR